MKALSLTQPWATLVSISAKTIETRSWSTPYRGRVAIHAAKGFYAEARALCFQEPFYGALHEAGLLVGLAQTLGAIIAVATLEHVGQIVRLWDEGVGVRGKALRVDGDELAFGDYTPGRFGWVLRDVRRLDRPIACRGALGLWDVPAEVAVEIERSLR